MSRPFSYNDENFTVIGNMLFVHFLDSKARKADEPVIEIPPAIFSRMVTYSNVATISVANYTGGGYTGIKVIMVDNKPYLAFTLDRSETASTRCYNFIYLLKDI